MVILHKWLKFSLIALFGGGFLALLLYVFLMEDAIRSANVEPPLILAAEGPVKRHPEQPGGLQIPDQDKLVFDLLDEGAGGAVEPQQPETIDDIVLAEEQQAPVAAADILPQETTQAVDSRPAPPAPAAEEAAPVVQAAEPAIVTAAAAVAESKPAAGGNWGVQLASVRVEADARAALNKLRNQFPALGGLEGRVQAAEVKGNTSYRVQFVGLESRAAASALCSRLAPQACLPVSR